MTLAETTSQPLATNSHREPLRGTPLRVRWLGRVPYAEALDLQQQLFAGTDDHLLLLEHPAVYTMGVRAKAQHLLIDPVDLGAELHQANRGGDVTFHGPGQLVGYPIMNVPGRRGGGMADTVSYVTSVEQVVINTLADLGLEATRLNKEPGVWLDVDAGNPRKIAAVGVRLSRGRSMHGFALNVNVDMDWFKHMIPCGITDKGVTSLQQEGIDASMEEVADLVAKHAADLLSRDGRIDRQDVAWRHSSLDLSAFSRGEGPGEAIKPERSLSLGTDGSAAALDPATSQDQTIKQDPAAGVPVRLRGRLADAGVSGGLDLSSRKPEWMRVKLKTDASYRRLQKTSRELNLTTVCEEAGCPNIFECWNEGTATFMLLGERCTRACGFCLVDTNKPGVVDLQEPQRIADAVLELGLDFVVLTMVARDDLDDGGAQIVAETITAIHDSSPDSGVEVLISDLRGKADSLRVVLEAKPDVLNHNTETVPRLQRAVRPSASYARSLTVLSRAKQAGMTTKSGLIVGMGEAFDEVVATMTDLAAIGVDIVTVGQYLRPTTHHLPVARWWTPEEFAELKQIGEGELGLGHVESSPLTRSSHHAGQAAAAVRS